jgi:hypothetical protein
MVKPAASDSQPNLNYLGGWDLEDPVWNQPRQIHCETLFPK